MKFHTDHYFAIGAAHLSSGKPCQDHALSGFGKNLACAVISDGCSSGGHTDVGARIITLSTMQAMRDSVKMASIEAISLLQQNLLASSRALFGLAKTDMLATCAFACATPDEGAIVHVQGDGTVAIKMRDGSVDLHRFEWENNAPFYPAYAANGEEYVFFAYHGARAILADKIGGELGLAAEKYVKTGSMEGISAESLDRIIGYGKDSPALSVETIKRDVAGAESSSTRVTSASEGIRGLAIRVEPGLLPQVSLIGVFSDGVSQVENMDWKEATTTFLGAKVLRGEFVKRSMIFGIRGMRARGKGPLDDVSGAMICIEQEEE